MKADAFISRGRALIAQGEKILTTKRPPPPNVVSDHTVDASGFAEQNFHMFMTS
jgi:hypothetical protein